jgi:glycosyltransferase involved in cell wall biosynthesis
MAGSYILADAGSLTIGIDTRQLVAGISGGLVQTLVGVFREVFVRYPEHNYIVFCTKKNRNLFNANMSNVKFIEFEVGEYLYWFNKWLEFNRVDILFRTYPDAEPLNFAAMRQIVYIPDNQHDFHPEFFSPDVLDYRSRAFAMALAEAGAVGTVSEFSRKALAARPECRCKIFLMSPALQTVHVSATRNPPDRKEAARLPRNEFFYYPANLWPHKNHRRILTAFRDFTRRFDRRFSFVFTGHPDGWREISREFADLDIRHLGYVSAGLVNLLMKRATALVFFSLFEGFGVPLLEAFNAGTPVLCSNVTSLPEVAGDAALMADPLDISAMTAAMLRITTDLSARQELIERGRARLSAYSWRQSADNLIQACAMVANNAKLATKSKSILNY